MRLTSLGLGLKAINLIMRNIKAKYNRIIEAQIISNLNIEAGVAQTKYGAELFYIGEIRNQAIRRGFYNVLHRLFVVENNSAKNIEPDTTLNSKVRYTLLKVARALYTQNSVQYAGELLDRLDASNMERKKATAAIKSTKIKARVTSDYRVGAGVAAEIGLNKTAGNNLSIALMARVVACMDAWAVEAWHRQEVRPAGIAADAPYSSSFRERRVTFAALFAAWVSKAQVVIARGKHEAITPNGKLRTSNRPRLEREFV